MCQSGREDRGYDSYDTLRSRRLSIVTQLVIMLTWLLMAHCQSVLNTLLQDGELIWNVVFFIDIQYSSFGH